MSTHQFFWSESKYIKMYNMFHMPAAYKCQKPPKPNRKALYFIRLGSVLKYRSFI